MPAISISFGESRCTMLEDQDYISINRDSWNRRLDYHLGSGFYDLETWLKGGSSLNDIELKLLGDVSGKSILHLQCHFGQDTLSLARMGARVTGVDLSDKAIGKARELASHLNLDAQFICSDLYALPDLLDTRFDIVFTSYGTIGWLPDLDKWAAVVARFLKPGGAFVFAEFHPVVWMFDDTFQYVGYRYFNSGPITEVQEGTYADRNAPVQLQSVNWNHSISEVINSLIRQGLQIRSLDEFDYSPYNCFMYAVAVAPGKYRIAHLEDKIPMVYAISAINPSV